MSSLIIHNADILTQNIYHPRAQAMLVENNLIKAVGSNEEIFALQNSGTQCINANGNTVLPGFIDAHIHIWKVGNLKTFLLDVRGVSSIEELQDKLSDFVKCNPGDGWLQARGFNEALMKEGRLPAKDDLDKVTTNRPLWLIRTCAHIGVANSKAIELSGVNNQTHIPVGGEMRLGNNGKPNGIFTETALGLITNHIPPYSSHDYAMMIKAAEDEMISYGITSATDPAVMPDLLACYQQLEKEKKLRIRVNAFPVRVPDGADEILALPGKYYSDKLIVHTVKFFADGGLSGMTAAMMQPYKNSSSTGVLRLTENFFYPIAYEAVQNNFGIATHAIGDKAIDVVLNVYKKIKNKNAGAHLRIEHLGLPSPSHLQRMKAMNIHCVSQSIFLKELGKNFALYLEEKRLNSIYPYRSVLDAGINLSLSSDAPVVKDFNPFTGIKAAMNRQDVNGNILGPAQKISLQESLYAYTMGSAKANGNENQAGSIEAGKCADFIILNKNLHEGIDDAKVLQTFINGELQYLYKE